MIVGTSIMSQLVSNPVNVGIVVLPVETGSEVQPPPHPPQPHQPPPHPHHVFPPPVDSVTVSHAPKSDAIPPRLSKI